MGDGFGFDIILFAMIAAFLVLRLRSVLGRRTGTEKPREFRPLAKRDTADNGVALPDPARPRETPQREELAPLPSNPHPAAPAGGLAQIASADPKFEIAPFLQGGRGAFEIIG